MAAALKNPLQNGSRFKKSVTNNLVEYAKNRKSLVLSDLSIAPSTCFEGLWMSVKFLPVRTRNSSIETGCLSLLSKK